MGEAGLKAYLADNYANPMELLVVLVKGIKRLLGMNGNAFPEKHTIFSLIGPAEQLGDESLLKASSSFLILFRAAVSRF